MKRIKAFFQNINLVKFIIKILVLINILFLIFIKFGNFIPATNSTSENTMVAPFSLPLYYNIDTFILSIIFVLGFINIFKNNRTIYLINIILGVINLITYIISFSFTSIITGFFILFILVYILEVILLYYSK